MLTSILGWLRNWWIQRAAENAVKNEIADDVKFLNENGGSDKLILAYLSHVHKNPEFKAQLYGGTLPLKDSPISRSLLGTAAIQSMMQARKELLEDLDAKELDDAKQRLDLAEQAFLLSWCVPDDTARPIDAESARRRVAESMKQGRAALETWRAADPMTFPIVVKVKIEFPSKAAAMDTAPKITETSATSSPEPEIAVQAQPETDGALAFFNEERDYHGWQKLFVDTKPMKVAEIAIHAMDRSLPAIHSINFWNAVIDHLIQGSFFEPDIEDGLREAHLGMAERFQAYVRAKWQKSPDTLAAVEAAWAASMEWSVYQDHRDQLLEAGIVNRCGQVVADLPK